MFMPRSLRSWFLFPIVCSTVLVPSRAQHMNEPDSPCANIGVTVDLTACLDKARASANGELNALYADVRKRLEDDERKQLVAAQRLWISYRDANCAAERDLYGTGTGRGPAYLACLEAMTRERTKELHVTYRVRLK